MTAATGDPIDLGQYKTGEIPRNLAVTFTNADGTAINLETEGYEVAGFWRANTDAQDEATALDPAPVASGTTAIVDWPPECFATVGLFVLELWAGDADTRLASRTFTFQVTESVAPAPTFS